MFIARMIEFVLDSSWGVSLILLTVVGYRVEDRSLWLAGIAGSSRLSLVAYSSRKSKAMVF